jgi:hypothetical protein
MKACGDLETPGMVRITTSRSAVIASPDRWLAGVHAAALRFVAWEPHQVRSGWLGGQVSLVHATSRSVVSLAGLALDAGSGSTWNAGPSPLHDLLGLAADAVVQTCVLRYGDVITVHARGGCVMRLVTGPADALALTA